MIVLVLNIATFIYTTIIESTVKPNLFREEGTLAVTATCTRYFTTKLAAFIIHVSYTIMYWQIHCLIVVTFGQSQIYITD